MQVGSQEELRPWFCQVGKRGGFEEVAPPFLEGLLLNLSF